MYFECSEGLRGKNGLHVDRQFHSIDKNPKDRYGKLLDGRNSKLELWHSILWTYGHLALTKPSDKLPAISGLARIFAENLNDTYVAGLWRKNLIEGLLWTGLWVRQAPVYCAPSWSWASVDGIASTGIDYRWESLADILECEVELKGKNAFGEVRNGWIKLRAPLVPLILDEHVDPEETDLPYHNNPTVRTEKGVPEVEYSRFDYTFTGPRGRENAFALVKSLKGVDIFTLILAKIFMGEEEENIFYNSLIVRNANGNSSAMQRLGTLMFSIKFLGECSQLDCSEERSIVKLI
jgi:hypothetical protein